MESPNEVDPLAEVCPVCGQWYECVSEWRTDFKLGLILREFTHKREPDVYEFCLEQREHIPE